MDDVPFLALAEWVVRYVEERIGRIAAWMTALIMGLLPIALLAGAALWYLG